MTDTPTRKSWWRSPQFTPLEYLAAVVLVATAVYVIARFT